jgi:hypothetical protein
VKRYLAINRYIGVDSYRKEEKSYSLQLKGIRPLITKLPNPTMLTANDKLTTTPSILRCWGKSYINITGTCFIQKIYAPSSSLLQGKHLPFSSSPLRLNIFRLFVILSLTQLYRYTPEIFSVIETDTATSGLRWIFHMHLEFSRPTMCNNATWSSPLKCKVSL